MRKRHEKPESMLDKALRILRVQRISVKTVSMGAEGPARRVDGVLLTDAQIVDLYKANRLTEWGLQEFAKTRPSVG
jgi:hypothetical protein